MQSQLNRKDKELKNVKQQLKSAKVELDKVNEKTKVYQDARNKLVFSGLYATVEFDNKIVSIANDMHNAYEQERQVRLAEQARQAELARLAEQARQAELARLAEQTRQQVQANRQQTQTQQVERSDKVKVDKGMDLG